MTINATGTRDLFMAPDAIDRFSARIIVDAYSGCWNWRLGKNHDGYGRLFAEGRTWLAHRYTWAVLRGDVPPGTELDHLCRNRPCCNPAHLEAVRHEENCRRATVDICPKCNTPYSVVVLPSRTQRYCPRFRREYMRVYHQRQKAKHAEQFQAAS